MAKKVTDNQRKEMVDSFLNGKSIDELSHIYNFSKITVSRNLKISVGESEYKKLVKRNKKIKQNHGKIFDDKFLEKDFQENKIENISINDTSYSDTEFFEIVPLDSQMPNETQKDFASIPISEITFPSIVYMIVDKKIELETKFLKDYPYWNFLSKEELNRKTIEIYFDLKVAKRFCSKEQKVLKVQNPDVFKTVAPILVSRGISRIVTDEKLISL